MNIFSHFLFYFAVLQFHLNGVSSFAPLLVSYCLYLTIVFIGFPSSCPPGCDCKKFDCSPNAPWQLKCGFSDGFCDMMNNRTHKPKYRMNWVRVYQDPNDELQKMGCSTPERPSRKFIEAHESKYKQVGDVRLMDAMCSRGALVYNCLFSLSPFQINT